MTQSNPQFSPTPHRTLRIGILLLLLVLALDLLFMPRLMWGSDAAYWRTEAATLLSSGHLWIDPQIAAQQDEPGHYFVFNAVTGRFYSKYGIANTLMSLPPMAAERWITGKMPDPQSPNLHIATAWNILLTLALAAVLFLIAARYSDNPWRRAAYVMACLFATFLWYYQRAQESEIYHALFFALAYECLLRAYQRRHVSRWLTLAWVFVGLLVMSRLFYLILLMWLILAAGFVLMMRGRGIRRILFAAVLPALVILALVGWINDLKFGSPFLTGYHQYLTADYSPSLGRLDGLYSMAFSGHWSIFVYFPLLFLAIPPARRFAGRYRFDAAIIFSVFFMTVFVLGSINGWRGEWAYGPRYMIFVLPVASLPALLFCDGPHSRRLAAWTGAAVAALVLGISVLMEFEVIRSDFWLFYKIEQPLQRRMDRDVAECLFDRHEAMLFHDLYSHRDNLDDTYLFHRLRLGKCLTPRQMTAYQTLVQSCLDNTNLYWWPPK